MWNEALVAAPTDDPLWVITSPNMDFVPAPSVGQIEVVLREDYRYGVADPTVWPQTFSPGFEYVAAIVRKSPDVPERFAALWSSPTRDDFTLIEGSVIKCLGLLHSRYLKPLFDLVDELCDLVVSHPMNSDPRLASLEIAMRHARDRLIHFPCTWRDVCIQVRECQRYWLMTRAFIDFYSSYEAGGPSFPVNRNLIGAFTTDPVCVQKLYNAGIPVWWLRMDASLLADTSVRAVVALSLPDDVCSRHALDAQLLYRGLAGQRHIQAMTRGGHTYQDITRNVLLAVETDRGYGSPIPQKEYKQLIITRSSNSVQSGPQRNVPSHQKVAHAAAKPCMLAC